MNQNALEDEFVVESRSASSVASGISGGGIWIVAEVAEEGRPRLIDTVPVPSPSNPFALEMEVGVTVEVRSPMRWLRTRVISTLAALASMRTTGEPA